MNNHKENLIKDMSIIALSVLIAVILVKTEVLINILASSKELELFGSFIAGMFFTSVFTVAPATVVLVEIARLTYSQNMVYYQRILKYKLYA